jgi:histidinol-phosphate aminotransferase
MDLMTLMPDGWFHPLCLCFVVSHRLGDGYRFAMRSRGVDSVVVGAGPSGLMSVAQLRMASAVMALWSSRYRAEHRALLFDPVVSPDLSPSEAARYHGDQAAEPGMLDFAVNIRHAQPPAWLLQRLAARLPDLASYPGANDERTAIRAVAARHGRARDEVALLAGAAEGFALLGNLRSTLAAVIAPSFTSPDVALKAAGIPVHHVVLEPPFELAGVQVPDDADLVVVGNPTNPTSVLHAREQILELRRPGRIVVVDEAFVDSVPGEPQSLANDSLPDVLVLRSLTKTWSLAGLRVGYALGSPNVLAQLTAWRAHWPVGTLQLTAIAACCAPDAVAEAAAGAQRLAGLRAEMVSGLQSVGAHLVDGCAPFVLFTVPDAELIRKHLHSRRIAVRRCDTFTGLDGRYLRAAVRPEWPVLVEQIGNVAVSGVVR